MDIIILTEISGTDPTRRARIWQRLSKPEDTLNQTIGLIRQVIYEPAEEQVNADYDGSEKEEIDEVQNRLYDQFEPFFTARSVDEIMEGDTIYINNAELSDELSNAGMALIAVEGFTSYVYHYYLEVQPITVGETIVADIFEP